MHTVSHDCNIHKNSPGLRVCMYTVSHDCNIHKKLTRMESKYICILYLMTVISTKIHQDGELCILYLITVISIKNSPGWRYVCILYLTGFHKLRARLRTCNVHGIIFYGARKIVHANIL